MLNGSRQTTNSSPLHTTPRRFHTDSSMSSSPPTAAATAETTFIRKNANPQLRTDTTKKVISPQFPPSKLNSNFNDKHSHLLPSIIALPTTNSLAKHFQSPPPASKLGWVRVGGYFSLFFFIFLLLSLFLFRPQFFPLSLDAFDAQNSLSFINRGLPSIFKLGSSAEANLDLCPSDCLNRCFMFSCYCNENRTTNCVTPLNLKYSASNWTDYITSLHLALVAEADNPNPLTNFLTPAFSYFVHLPLRLGSVLELTGASIPIIYHLLNVQPRYVDNITIISQLIEKYKESPYSVLKEGKINNVPINLTMGYLPTSIEKYDTVIVVNYTAQVEDPFLLLRSIYESLVVGGHLVFYTDTDVWSDAFIVNHMHHWYDVLYETDKAVFSRLKWAIYVQEMKFPESWNEGTGKFFIAKKRSLSTVVNVNNLTFAPPPPLPSVPPFEPLFHLVWTSNKLMPWRLLVIDSIFFHHPTAVVNVYGNELHQNDTQFDVFRQKGLNITAHPLDIEVIFADTPILEWVRKEENRVRSNFVSDALRLALVWRHGGCYVDFDIIVLQPLNYLRNMLARELPNGMVNGAILPFWPKHPFIHLLMIMFPRKVRLESYTSGGPSLQSNTYHLYHQIRPNTIRFLEVPSPSDPIQLQYDRDLVTLYTPTAFFANRWMDAPDHRYWTPEKFDQNHFDQTMKEQYIFHIWKQMLGRTLDHEEDYVFKESFMGRMFLKNCFVLCDEIRRVNQGKNPVWIPALPKEKKEL